MDNAKTYKDLFDSAFDLIVFVGIKGNILDINQAGERVTGYKKNALLKKNVLKDLVLTEDIPIVKKVIKELMRNNDQVYNVRWRNKNGETIHFEASSSGLFDEKGKFISTRCVLRDVTLRVDTEEQFAQQQNKLANLVENIPGAIYTILLDEHWTIDYVSRGSVEVLGYTPEELIGAHAKDLFLDPEDISRSTEIQDKAIKSGETVENEFRLKHKSGREVWLLDRFKCVYDQKGKPLTMEGIVFDITHRKEAEKKLSESEERFQRFTESAFEGIGIAVDGIIQDTNTRLCEMTGYTLEELVGSPISKIVYPDDRELVKKRYESDYRSAYEFRLLRKDGTPLWVEIRGVNAMYKGRNARIAGIHDISDQRKAARALMDSEERFRSVVHDQIEMIARWKPNGVRTFVNEAYCAYFDLDREEAIGTSFFTLVAKRDLKRVKLRIKSITPENPISTSAHEIFAPDGSITWLEWTDRGFFDERGKIVDYQSVGRNITNQRLAEQALAASEERLSLIYNSTTDMMGLAEIRGDQFVFVSFNQAARDTLAGLGIKDKDYLGVELRTYSQMRLNIGGEQLDDLISHYQSVVKHKQPVSMEHVMESADGKTLYLNTSLNPILDKEKNCTHVLWSSRDVTSERTASLQLKEAFSELSKLQKKLEQENIYLREEIKLQHNFEEIIFASDNFRQVLNKVEQVAETDATVLILGETGTGKELIARAIHDLRSRDDQPLVKLNCATLPKELIESELFGHEKGAFTGAVQRKIGKFELANGGTMFLDEIGEIPLDLQVKLLRVLQEGEIERIGGTQTISLDVRVVAATNRNLTQMIEQGKFRSDLYYRLNVFPIFIPPLRERIEDIPLLIQHFVDKYAPKYGRDVKAIRKTSMMELQNYNWPGNIRELENLVERAIILSADGILNFEHFKEPEKEVLLSVSSGLSLQQVEHAHLLRILRECKWVVSGINGAAYKLGLKPSTLRDRMKKHGIQRPQKEQTKVTVFRQS